MTAEIEKIIVDIIKHEMSIDDSSIWIRSQNRDIPKTPGLFIVVGFSDAQVISCRNVLITGSTGIEEVQEVVQRENIQIDLLSRNNDARQKRANVLMALNSVYSQNKQDLYSFKIFSIPSSFVNVNVAEGGSELNRFTITIACNVWYNNTGDIDFYNSFPTELNYEDDKQETFTLST